VIPFIGMFAYSEPSISSSPCSLFCLTGWSNVSFESLPKKPLQSCVHYITFTSYAHWIIFSLEFLPLLSDFWLDLHVRLPVVRDTSLSLVFGVLLMNRVGSNFVWLNLQLFDQRTITLYFYMLQTFASTWDGNGGASLVNVFHFKHCWKQFESRRSLVWFN
jgi:hypothetical protein